MTARLLLEDLPESLRDVVDLIGLAATLNLVEHFGGLIMLYVPQYIGPEHPIAVAIGITAARKLSAHYSADTESRIFRHADRCLRNIPLCTAGLRRIRDAEIRRRSASESAASLAREFMLTERHVWRIIAEGIDSDDGKQAALF